MLGEDFTIVITRVVDKPNTIKIFENSSLLDKEVEYLRYVNLIKKDKKATVIIEIIKLRKSILVESFKYEFKISLFILNLIYTIILI